MVKVKLMTNVRPFAVELKPETTTIRQLFEEKGINYNAGTTTVNGINVSLGELDKTLRDIVPDPTVEMFFVSNVVKADNAVTAKVDGATCVVTSTMKREDLETAKKYRPNALTLYEGEGEEREPVFGVDVEDDCGSLNTCGAVFGKRTGEHGEAKITLAIPNSVSDPKKYVQDTYGYALLKIKAFEETLGAVIDEIAAEKAEIESHITMA